MTDRPWNRHLMATRGLTPRQQDICLPVNVISSIPQCSVQCLSDYTQTNYPNTACGTRASLTFLCTTTSISGLTLGEGALQCVASTCGSEATNDNLVIAFNLCAAVPSRLPNTASVIRATISPATVATRTSATTVQSSISATSPSTSPPNISSILMGDVGDDGPEIFSADGAPMTMDIMMISPSLTSSEAAPTSTEQHSNFMPETMMPDFSEPLLTTPQIAGIATGGGVAALILIALIFIFVRRRRHARQMSQSWPEKSAISPPTNTGAAPFESFDFDLGEKRRSMWRKSVRPDGLGVAFAAKRPQSSASFSSQSGMLRQLRGSATFTNDRRRTLWPTPLGLNPTRGYFPTGDPRRGSSGTVFDEDIEQLPNEPERIAVEGATFSLAEPRKAKRQKPTPEPLSFERNTAVSPSFTSGTSRTDASSMPLTPTYDNGNVVANKNRPYAANSIDAALASNTSPSSQLSALPPLPEYGSPTSLQSLRSRFQKSPTIVYSPTKNSREALPRPMPTWQRTQDSETTTGTIIEEDTSPEEENKQLGSDKIVHLPSPTISLGSPSQPRSPISNLQYPSIPRSAAVSRYAEAPARPRNNTTAVSSVYSQISPRLRRDILIRNEASFMATDSTSSDGYMSDYSIEWPVPPSRKGARADHRPSQLSDTSRRDSETTSGVPSLTPKAKLTPTKSNTGDLYFKVEMS